MLLGSSFRLTFVFSINPLILSGFFFTSFHLAATSLLYLLLRGLILLCVQLSRNMKKYLLFIIIHVFSTHFAVNLFFGAIWKRANYWAAAAPCIWTNEIKTKTKPSHATFRLTTRFIVRFTLKTMQWYH